MPNRASSGRFWRSLPYTREKLAVESSRARDSQVLGRIQGVSLAFRIWRTWRHDDHRPSHEQDPVSATDGDNHKQLTFKLGVVAMLFLYAHKPTDISMEQKLMVLQILNKFIKFCATLKIITVFTSVRHWSLSWARWVHSTPWHSISLRTINLHLNRALPIGLLLSGFRVETN